MPFQDRLRELESKNENLTILLKSGLQVVLNAQALLPLNHLKSWVGVTEWTEQVREALKDKEMVCSP